MAGLVIPQGAGILVGVVVGWLVRAAAASEQDPLTGLANARGFERAIHLAVNDVERLGRSLAVVTVDLDHFKSVNETGGHVRGDRVLGNVANTWQAMLDDNGSPVAAATNSRSSSPTILPTAPSD